MAEIRSLELNGRSVRMFVFGPPAGKGLAWQERKGDDGLRFAVMDVAIALGFSHPKEASQKHCRSWRPLQAQDLRNLGIAANAGPLYGLMVSPRRDVFRLIRQSALPEAEKRAALATIPDRFGGPLSTTCSERTNDPAGKWSPP